MATTDEAPRPPVPDSAFPFPEPLLQKKLLELVIDAQHRKKVVIGQDNVRAAIERGTAELVLLAADTVPIELLLPLTLLAEANGVCFVFVASRMELGRAAGKPISVTAACIVKGEPQLQHQLTFYRREIERLLI